MPSTPSRRCRNGSDAFYRLLSKLEQGERINILMDPGGVNSNIENSITFSQRDILAALRSVGHTCSDDQNENNGDWDLILSVISHADNAAKSFAGYEFHPRSAFVVGETTRIPPRWVHGYANAIDIIMTKTSYVRHALASSGIPWPRLHTVSPPLSPSFTRDPVEHESVDEVLRGLGGMFVFFTHFQSASTFYGRKSWRLLLDTFAREFEDGRIHGAADFHRRARRRPCRCVGFSDIGQRPHRRP